jgi:MFS family permease
VFLVVLAIDVLGIGQSGVGTLNAAMGLGGLLSLMLTAGVVRTGRLGRLLAIALCVWGGTFALLAFTAVVPVAIALLVVVGIANAFVDVSSMGLIQGTVPDRDRSGALGAMSALVSLGHVGGVLVASLLLTVVGEQAAIVLVALMLPGMAIALWPRWRRLDEAVVVPVERLDALRACALFQPLTLAQLEHLAARMQRVSYDAGDPIVREGDPGDGFYLVTEGEVRVSKDGRELRRMGAGSSFGEIALLRGVPRTASVTALGPVTGWRLDAAAFLSAITGNTWSRAAAEDIAQRYLPATSS